MMFVTTLRWVAVVVAATTSVGLAALLVVGRQWLERRVYAWAMSASMAFAAIALLRYRVAIQDPSNAMTALMLVATPVASMVSAGLVMAAGWLFYDQGRPLRQASRTLAEAKRLSGGADAGRR